MSCVEGVKDHSSGGSVEAAPVDYGVFDRIFRTSVYQESVRSVGWLERVLIFIYRMFAESTFCPPALDEERQSRSLSTLQQLGGQEHFIDVEKAKIHGMTWKAADLEKILTAKRASWEKRGSKFVIVPPSNRDDNWNTFQQEVLCNKTGWEEKEGVIVTCENADLIPDDTHYCFLHIHGPGASFVRDRKRVGFYLGMKQDVCMYDPRGMWKSTGVPSEGGYYLDAEGLCSLLLAQGYQPNQLWVSGKCGGAPVAAHLKRLYHEQGINFMPEQAFVQLQRDMLDPQFCLVRWVSNWCKDSLQARDLLTPNETGFDTEAEWKDLRLSSQGKVVIIYANEEPTLPPHTEQTYEALAQKVNSSVFSIGFSVPPGVNGHNDSCLLHIDARKLTQAIF